MVDGIGGSSQTGKIIGTPNEKGLLKGTGANKNVKVTYFDFNHDNKISSDEILGVDNYKGLVVERHKDEDGDGFADRQITFKYDEQGQLVDKKETVLPPIASAQAADDAARAEYARDIANGVPPVAGSLSEVELRRMSNLTNPDDIGQYYLDYDVENTNKNSGQNDLQVKKDMMKVVADCCPLTSDKLDEIIDHFGDNFQNFASAGGDWTQLYLKDGTVIRYDAKTRTLAVKESGEQGVTGTEYYYDASGNFVAKPIPEGELEKRVPALPLLENGLK